MRRALGWLLLLAGIATGPGGLQAATAQSDDPEPALNPELPGARDHFAAGTAAFQRGDFTAALASFRAAEAAGLDGPAVAYNIGVCAWELGLLDDAESAFMKVAQYPSMAPTAYFNLGLVSQRRGDTASARTWFVRARDEATDEALRQLAAARIAADFPDVPASRPVAPPPPAPGRAAGFVILQAGYDDNVALVADGEAIGVSDTGSAFLETQFAGALPLGGGVRLEGSAFLLRYPSLGEFDQSGMRLGLLARRPMGTWTGEIGADFGLNRLDSKHFENRAGVALLGLRRLAGGWDLRLRYRYEDISGRGDFRALTGDRHEFAARLRHWEAGRKLQLEYRLEANDRQSDAVSPDRHRVEAQAVFDVPRNLQAAIGLGWRHSRYATATGDRNERRIVGTVGLLGPISDRLNWLVRVEFLDNHASRRDFDYQQQRFLAGVEAIF